MAEEDCKGKWSVMLQYIHSIGKDLYCHGIFRLWEEIDAVYGIQSLDRFMENKELLALAVNDGSYWGSSNNWYGGRDRFWKNLGFLDKEESVKLFTWAEEYFYKRKPEHYNDFLYEFLRKVAPEFLPAEEGRAMMETVISAAPAKSYLVDELRRIYYKPEEWDTYQRQEQERKEKEKEEARRYAVEKWKNEILAELDAAGTEKEKYVVFSKKLRESRYGDDDERKVYLELFEQRLQKGKIYAEEKELVSLAEELVSMVEYDLLDWKRFQEIIKNMEVSENESAGNGAA